LDNLLLAIQQRQEESLVGRFVLSKRVKQAELEAVARANEILDFVELAPLRQAPAACLGYGQLKLFVFGMALMSNPDLLLLDEPSAATDPTMVRKMKECIVKLNSEGKTILFVEHDMKVVMDIAQRIIVLDHGRIIAEGTPKAIQNEATVIEAYFGRRRVAENSIALRLDQEQT
jgi:branched-chain amino acid transport system ATP-binding protein